MAGLEPPGQPAHRQAHPEDSRPVAVITGTTHGIGRVSALELARAGRRVVMLCRDIPAAQDVRAGILAQVPGAAVEVVGCDLASLESVRAAAAAVRAAHPVIQLLINNAGIVSTRRRRSAEGYELTFATNHLGPFLLTQLLRDALVPGARIINVSSRVHYRGRLELAPGGADLAAITGGAGRYRSVAAYARSKLANVLHTFALARRLAQRGISANCLHPGVVATHLLPGWLNAVRPLFKRVILSPEQGARTTLYLALSREAGDVTGRYYDEHQQPQPAAAAALDLDLQERLWELSSRWTGLGEARE